MDPPNNAAHSDPKQKSREDKAQASASRSSSLVSDTLRDPRKYDRYCKKPERSLDRELLNTNRGKGIISRSRDAVHGEEKLKEMQQPYQVYGYPGYSMGETNYVNNGRNPMIPVYSSWSMPNVNAQWAINPMDSMNVNPALCVNTSSSMNMSPNMDMNGSAAVGVNPYPFLGAMSSSAGMCGVMGYSPYGMYTNDCNSSIIRPSHEVVHLTKCVLYPPSSLVPPPKREKPLGCKTVYVGGIPSNSTEEIIREVFQRFGEIEVVRMNSKNFCHVKFVNQNSVDAAIFYSGYRMCIDGKDDDPNTGRIHVDYAEAYDDQHVEDDPVQRASHHFEPELRPLLVPTYSEHEATDVANKLKKRDSFSEGLTILFTWIERGECSKRNACTIFSLMQSTYCHVHQLMNEKEDHEKEIGKKKAKLMHKSHSISLHFKEIAKVLHAARMQKVWDHFTRSHRRKLEELKKDTEEEEKAHIQEVVKDRNEVDMEVESDEEGDHSPRKTIKDQVLVPQEDEQKKKFSADIEELRRENSTLQCLLEASQNEVEVARSDTEQQRKFHDVQFQKVHQALKNAEKVFSTLSRAREGTSHPEQNPLKRKKEDGILVSEDENDMKGSLDVKKPASSTPSPSHSSFVIVEAHARFIGLISAFLNVHPFGASIDYICSYLHQIDSTILSRDIESLMKQFPHLFKEESTGIGASLEKKWTFCGFKPRV